MPMPERSVRQMSARERRRHSLAARSFRAVLLMAAVLGTVALVIGSSMYFLAVRGQYIRIAYNASAGAEAILRAVADPADCAAKVMETYDSLTEEEIQAQDAPAYRTRFRYLDRDENYQKIRSVLRFLKDNNDVQDIYLSIYDEQTMRLIYLVDPEDEPQYRCYPGTWEPVDRKELNAFLRPAGDRTLHVITNGEYGWLCTSGVPLQDGPEGLAVFVQADIGVMELVRHMGRFLFQYALVLILLTLAMAWAFARYFRRTLVEPVNQIAQAAETYARDRWNGAENADHFSRRALNIHTGDEVENLSLVMADMERDLNSFEEDLTRITAERERIHTELALATRIQADMLPNVFPPFPDRTEFDLYATMTPAKEVGGDFYDFFLADEDHLVLLIADVSGKGIPAALFMMASMILLDNAAMTVCEPGRVLEIVNEQICGNNREEMFITVWLGVLEISTGILTAANAGHEFPALRQGGGPFRLFHDKHGFVVGGLDGMKYRTYTLRLEPGDKLFLYTDGVAEAGDGDNAMFGMDRMLAALNQTPDAAPERLLSAVKDAVDSFVQGAPQFDDMTMLCLEYKEAGSNIRPDEKQGGT